MSFSNIPDPEDIKLLRHVLKTENRTKMLIELRRKLEELNLMKAVHVSYFYYLKGPLRFIN